MADRYWVGGAGTWNSSSTARWSTTSGGAAGASAPTSSDNVIFDVNSGGTFTVTCAGSGACKSITISSGTVTFNVASTATNYFTCYGDISISAATAFTTTSANSYGIISHQSSAATVSVAFGSSTTNTQKVYFSANCGSSTSYTFCTAATQTFHSVSITTSATGTFTCAGSTITVDNQDRATSGVSDVFNILQTSALSVAGTTINMGSVTANGGNTIANFVIQCLNRATEPTATGLNITYVRAYYTTSWNTKWYNTFGDGFPFKFGAITLKSDNVNSHSLTGVYATNGIFSATNINVVYNSQSSNAMTFGGAFTLAGSQFSIDNSAATPTSATFSSTTTLSISNAIAGSLDLSTTSGDITFTGAVSVTGSATSISYTSFGTRNSGTVLFSSTYTSTYELLTGNFYNVTFTGAVSFTDPILGNPIYVQNNITISNAFSITQTSSASTYFYIADSSTGATLTTSSTTAAWTFTNAKIKFGFDAAMTITNPVSLVDNGGLYWSKSPFGSSAATAGTLTLSAALTSSGVSKYNILSSWTTNATSITEAGTLNLNDAVTLVNCQLSAGTITVAGGSAKNFAYSLSTPVPNNIPSIPFPLSDGPSTNCNYPEIHCDAFTLTSAAGTFSISGGGSAIYRTFVRPFRLNIGSVYSPSCTMTLPALTPTLIDVDFWRVTIAGAVTKPLTGTRLGNVGTLSSTITTATPKTVYWVGGAGAWTGAKWATSSGGTGAATNYPLPQDTVIVDENSGTGNTTYPASVRIGTIQCNKTGVSAAVGMYCNATNINTYGLPAYMWISGSISGVVGSSDLYIAGSTNVSAYNSFANAVSVNSSTTWGLQNIVIAGGSSSDTHTIDPKNIQMANRGGILFATSGTININSGLNIPFYLINDLTAEAYTLTFGSSVSYFGSTAFDYFPYGYSEVGGYIGGYRFGKYAASVNYGSVYLINQYFAPSPTSANTAYSVSTTEVDATGASTVGNIIFDQNSSTLATKYQLTVDRATTILNLNVTTSAVNIPNPTSLRVTHNGTTPWNISMYSFTVTYTGTVTFIEMTQQFGAGVPQFVKLGGGNVSVSGVNVTSIKASPTNTWYTTGTLSGTTTGWNASAGPTSKGGFLLFQ
jgi:hypothetical protein